MGVIGATLIFGAVVYFVVRPPHSFVHYLRTLWHGLRVPPRLGEGNASDQQPHREKNQGLRGTNDEVEGGNATTRQGTTQQRPDVAGHAAGPRQDEREATSTATVTVAPTPPDDVDGEQATPKVVPASASGPAPSFSLSGPEDNDDGTETATPPAPSAPSPQPGLMAPPPPKPGSMPPPPSLGTMPPPPRPGLIPPQPASPPRLPPLSQQQRQSPYQAQGQLSRSTLPIPNRGGPVPPPSSSSSSSLAPPPTHSSKPTPPRSSSRLVALEPGHSPLDWARLSGGPNADLRNLPPGTPYLRVSPSMLRRRNGRKGRDAWSAYGGRVYNVTPYLPFHPGGKGELLRGAGKDATRLFGEVHPWVNYETMLAACLVGILVGEGEGDEDEKKNAAEKGASGGSNTITATSSMEEMD